MAQNDGNNISRNLTSADKELGRLSEGLPNRFYRASTQNKVELEQVSRILLMYSQALAGTEVQIRSHEELRAWSLGRMPPDTLATAETTIFVPHYMDRYNSADDNFAWYKVTVTHQAGHIEFGTFNFSFEKAASLFSNRQPLPLANKASLTDIERYLSLFGDRKLSTDIFAVVEDIRIDYLLKQEYAGIRGSYQQIQQESLSRRPPPFSLPLREAFLEILIRMGLGSELPTTPSIFRGPLQSAGQILQQVQSLEATVEDSAEATLRLYEIISAMPNKQLPAAQWGLTDLDETQFTATNNIPNARESGEDGALEADTELPYQSPTEVEFRGSFDPNLVQLRLELEEDPRYSAQSTSPFSLEDVKGLVNREIKLGEVLPAPHSPSGFYVTDLPIGTHSQEIPSDKQDEDKGKPKATSLGEENEEGLSFLYDEWDFRAGGYLPSWCRVRELPLPDGSADFFKETLAHNSPLAAQISRQFEMLAPKLLKKLSKLQDGEEFDLDAMIESVLERKAGYMPNDKIYWKKMKIQRDVAVVFLIDMSASTCDAIKDTDEEDDRPERYLNTNGMSSQLRARHTEGLTRRPRRRVIDVAKESVVLMINALESIGDCYGVYGFSSSGRDNVELLVIKGIDEELSPTVERRIDSIRPLFSTRMGPAIRHAASKLEGHDAKTKILFLITDGYPQDRDYGRDNDDKEYALHDTEMAFVEAKRKNIIPFCLAIDATGHDFLKEMSHDIIHEVVLNIKSLPQHLPILYKRLTS